MPESNTDLVHRTLASFNSEGIEEIIDLFAEDFEVEVPATLSAEPDVYRGHDGLRRWFAGFEGLMDEVRIVASEVEEVAPDTVIAAMNLIARGHSSGLEVEQPAAQVYRLRDGLVRKIEVYPTLEEARAAAMQSG